jgi:hypothetical protein
VALDHRAARPHDPRQLEQALSAAPPDVVTIPGCYQMYSSKPKIDNLWRRFLAQPEALLRPL